MIDQSKSLPLKGSKTLNCAIFVSTVILLCCTVFIIFKLDLLNRLYDDIQTTSWGAVYVGVARLILVGEILFLIYMIYQLFRYKPIESVPDHQLPKCTIIVPAYNEGALVYKTLLSLAQSNYPKELLQIIAIDDGSKDDTWAWIQKAKQEIGEGVVILQQETNKGKREALYRGFQMAEGEVLITVDSDSIVDKDAIRNIASPFVVDENCGAVAGNIRVLNPDAAIIPNMLNVSFVFSFEFVRSAQSALGSVLCTPGALSAYRKDVAMRCLPDWIAQTFMGKRATIGEDRAMTTMILKQGYNVLFQSNACVLTDVPIKFKQLSKMFLRWGRSNVRENIMMARFAFKDFRADNKTGSRILLLNQWQRMLLVYPFLISMVYFLLFYPLTFLVSTILGCFIFSSISAIFYYVKHRNVGKAMWIYPYSIMYAFSLFWITPYAIATASRTGWLTR